MTRIIITFIALYAGYVFFFDSTSEENSNRSKAMKKIEQHREYTNQNLYKGEKYSYEEDISHDNRNQLVQRFTDPGYLDASFPQNESFWIAMKNPPPNADMFAQTVCKVSKSDYNLKGFVITIWGFDKKKYGKFGCY